MVRKDALSVDKGDFGFTNEPHFSEQRLVLRNVLEFVCESCRLPIDEPDSLDASYQVRREPVAFSLHRARVFESKLHLDAWQVPSLVPEPAT